MRIEVELFATLAAFLPAASKSGRAFLEIPDASTVADVGATLGIPEDLERIVLVNGVEAESSRRLGPGDVVTLFPPLAGGSSRRDAGYGRRRGSLAAPSEETGADWRLRSERRATSALISAPRSSATPLA